MSLEYGSNLYDAETKRLLTLGNPVPIECLFSFLAAPRVRCEGLTNGLAIIDNARPEAEGGARLLLVVKGRPRPNSFVLAAAAR